MVIKEQENSLDSVANKSTENETDQYIRITAAHQMLTKAQAYDEQNNYPAALQFYRVCVDFLLEELIFAESTEQSRTYLQNKCTSIMDRIDFLKTKLDPIPSYIAIEQSADDNSPTAVEQLTHDSPPTATEQLTHDNSSAEQSEIPD